MPLITSRNDASDKPRLLITYYQEDSGSLHPFADDPKIIPAEKTPEMLVAGSLIRAKAFLLAEFRLVIAPVVESETGLITKSSLLHSLSPVVNQTLYFPAGKIITLEQFLNSEGYQNHLRLNPGRDEQSRKYWLGHLEHIVDPNTQLLQPRPDDSGIMAKPILFRRDYMRVLELPVV